VTPGDWVVIGLGGASLLSWLWLLLARGMFWQTEPRLHECGRPPEPPGDAWPAVGIVIPARNEACVIEKTLPSRLSQDYPGEFRVYLVDDSSTDGTADTARRAASGPYRNRLTVVRAAPVPPGWTGKVWALAEGVGAGSAHRSEFYLFSDADISLDPDVLRAMVSKAVSEDRDTVSVMARLHAESIWERLLIPAFVYFFAKLYPFRWIGDPGRRTAGAAGGCTLVRRVALEHAGGLEEVAGELIDDCALAALVQRAGRSRGGPGRLWLGYHGGVRSERAYGGPGPIWRMVARSAYVQLRRSPLLLVGTVIGMVFLYALPPTALIAGAAIGASGGPVAAAIGLGAGGFAAWVVMAASYVPVLRWHGVSALLAPLLPLAAIMYTGMTLDSARCHWLGLAGAWKGRTYRELA
jgi:hopene-associated glycosyltransferase HpnB